MNRILKQVLFGSIYLAIFFLIAAGVYFFYLKPAPSCFDNKQNQKETGVDCGGPCIPCELKDLNLVTEEVRVFPAGKNQITLFARVKNPSPNYGASFSYVFELDGTLLAQSKELKGKAVIYPQATKYLVIPALPLDSQNVRRVDLQITDLNWDEKRETRIKEIEVVSQTNINKNKVTVTGILTNNSAASLPLVNLTALLFDEQGQILNTSITKLEKVEAFSQKQFLIFFPEVEELTQKLDLEKTEVFWELNE